MNHCIHTGKRVAAGAPTVGLLLAGTLAAALTVSAVAQTRPGGLYAEIATAKGVIVLLLDFERAPMTVASFVGLAEGTIDNEAFPPGRPFFDGSRFNRVVPGHVIQGGLADSEVSSNSGYSIPNEIHPDLLHSRAGMLGMANAGPHTASNSFYITLDDRPYLDGDYAVFGEVFSGMEVVMRIVADDRMDSVRIVRVGQAAEAFRPTTASFRQMVQAVWEQIRAADLEKGRFEADHVRSGWPAAEDGAEGWQYVVVEEGAGSAPGPGKRISLRYTGHTPQGLEFASTAEECAPSWRGEPEQPGQQCNYVVGESSVTRGLDAALARMKPGARWIVIVPSEIGYPSPGYYPPARPGEPRFHISPNTLLIYDIEVER